MFYSVFNLPTSIWATEQNPTRQNYVSGRPEEVSKYRPDILRTAPYGPICNAKGRSRSGTSLRPTQDVNLTIIHKMGFYGIFFYFS